MLSASKMDFKIFFNFYSLLFDVLRFMFYVSKAKKSLNNNISYFTDNDKRYSLNLKP